MTEKVPDAPASDETARVEAAALETAREDNAVLALLRSSAGRNAGLVVALLILCVVGAATAGDRFTSTDNALTILPSPWPRCGARRSPPSRRPRTRTGA